MDNRMPRSTNSQQLPVQGTVPYPTTNGFQESSRARPVPPQPQSQPQPGSQPFMHPQAYPPPGALSAVADNELRQTIVSILSSAANGCLTELGYTDLYQRCTTLERENQTLKQQCQTLQNQIATTQGLFNHASSAERALRQQNNDLLEKLRILENERKSRRKVDAVVQATDHSSTMLPLQYAELKRKYHQALVTLASHRVLHNLEPNHTQEQLAKQTRDIASTVPSSFVQRVPSVGSSSTHMGHAHLQAEQSSSSIAPPAKSPTVANGTSQGRLPSLRGTIATQVLSPLNGRADESPGPSPLIDHPSKKQIDTSRDVPRPTSGSVKGSNSLPRETHATSIYSSSELLSGDNSVHLQTEAAIDVDIEMGDDADEDDCADLTDDEAGTKQSLVECVSAVFFDDDDDVRYCRLCNNRLEMNKKSEEKPTFSEHSMRELVQHLKNEHPKAWACLRNETKNERLRTDS